MPDGHVENSCLLNYRYTPNLKLITGPQNKTRAILWDVHHSWDTWRAWDIIKSIILKETLKMELNEAALEIPRYEGRVQRGGQRRQQSSLRTSWITDGPQYCPSFVPGHGDQFSLRIRKIYFKEYSLSYLWDVQNPCAVLINLFLFHFEATLVVKTVTISDLSFLLYLNWSNLVVKNAVRTPSLSLPHSFGFSLPLLSPLLWRRFSRPNHVSFFSFPREAPSPPPSHWEGRKRLFRGQVH